jgi:type II secretory pathway pseudopilin PulG
MPRRRAKHGFTVVELMVSLCVGGIAISSLYAVGAASTRHFREQQRISTTQGSLRAAMNQLKRDFARAGFLATPNASLNGEFCGARLGAPLNSSSNTPGDGRLAGISAFHKKVAKPTELDPDNLNEKLAVVDDVILMGNYATSGEYMGIQMSGDNRTVFVPVTSQSFTRDFTNWYAAGGVAAGACNTTTLQTAFPRGRLVRIRNRVNTNGFAQVDRAECIAGSSNAQIALQAQVNGCNPNGGWVAPVNTIRYHAENASADAEMSRVRIGNLNRVAQLRRTEMDPAAKDKPLLRSDGSNLPVDDRAILDYVVRFTVDFIVRTVNANTISIAPATEAVVQANPEYVRGAIIEIAARTAEHEPDMDVSLTTARLPPFRVFKTQGAARTRSLRAEIFIPNVALAKY